MGWTANATHVSRHVPNGTPPGTLHIGVRGTNQGRTVERNLPVTVVNDDPTAQRPVSALIQPGGYDGTTTLPTSRHVAGRHRSDQPDRRLPGPARAATAAAWGGTIDRTERPDRKLVLVARVRRADHRFRVRALDGPGTGAPWAEPPTTTRSVRGRRPQLARSSYGGSWVGGQQLRGVQASTVIGTTQARGRRQPDVHGPRCWPWSARQARIAATSNVYIDGVLVKTISMWRRRPLESTPRRLRCASFPVAVGTHTDRPLDGSTRSANAIRWSVVDAVRRA